MRYTARLLSSIAAATDGPPGASGRHLERQSAMRCPVLPHLKHVPVNGLAAPAAAPGGPDVAAFLEGPADAPDVDADTDPVLARRC